MHYVRTASTWMCLRLEPMMRICLLDLPGVQPAVTGCGRLVLKHHPPLRFCICVGPLPYLQQAHSTDNQLYDTQGSPFYLFGQNCSPAADDAVMVTQLVFGFAEEDFTLMDKSNVICYLLQIRCETLSSLNPSYSFVKFSACKIASIP